MNESYAKRDKLAMAVACMTRDGRRQSEIMRVLGIPSQSEVSRLLSHARKRSWLVTRVNLPPDVPAEEIETLVFPQREELFAALAASAKAQGPVELTGLHIVYAGAATAEEQDRLRLFGRRAAEHVASLLRPASYCAVAWGRTIHSVIAGVRRSQPGDEWRDVQFFPISGEPINHPSKGVSASTAAARLRRYFRSTPEALSLNGIPIRIPRGFDADGQAWLRRFVDKCEPYRRIFGDDDRLMSRADAILTGLGDAKSSGTDPLFLETRQLEDRPAGWLHEHCIGNLGGVWLPKVEGDPEVEDMNRRWLGVQLSDFEACGGRANAPGSVSPGVIVTAVGATKVDILRRALGRINHLVIDQVLAKALLAPPPG